MRRIIALTGLIFVCSIGFAQASDNFETAQRALNSFSTEESLSALTEFNSVASTLTRPQIQNLDPDHIHKAETLLEDLLPLEIGPLEMGSFPLYESLFTDIILFYSTMRHRLHEESPIKERLLGVCSLYRSWNNIKHPVVHEAIEAIYQQYHEPEDIIPISTSFWTMGFTDKVIFQIAFGYSYPMATPTRRYSTISLFSLACALWYMKRRYFSVHRSRPL
jgi:hypothetical protein